MIITKTLDCKTIEELMETIKKLLKRSTVKVINFNGTINQEAKSTYFSVNWTEEVSEI